jgi:hypothetical protein
MPTIANMEKLNGIVISGDNPVISAMIQSDSGGSSTGDGAGTKNYIDYKWIRFEASGYLNVTNPGNAEILVVAGGGGGGEQWAGGGGAGGLLYGASVALTTGVHTITVGAGGTVGSGSNATDERGNPGGNSVFDATGVSITGGAVAVGGGGGGPDRGHEANGRSSGGDGGSGGGNGRYSRYVSGASDFTSAASSATQGDDGGLTGFGNAGATSTVNDGYVRGHGGGGAGAVGQEQTDYYGNRGSGAFGNGGAGKNYSITGSAVGYAGGGAGCTMLDNGDSIATGSHGGGNGAGYVGGAGTNAVAGTANTGGGGGGGASNNWSGATDAAAAGGSGVVIVRYKFR